MTISLQSATGHADMRRVLGMLMFTQYWYWHSLSHCIALAFKPTAVIGLNKELKVGCGILVDGFRHVSWNC